MKKSYILLFFVLAFGFIALSCSKEEQAPWRNPIPATAVQTITIYLTGADLRSY